MAAADGVRSITSQDVLRTIRQQANFGWVGPVRVVTDAGRLPSGLPTVVRLACADIGATAIGATAIAAAMRAVGARAVGTGPASIRSDGIRAVGIRAAGIRAGARSIEM